MTGNVIHLQNLLTEKKNHPDFKHIELPFMAVSENVVHQLVGFP